MTCKPRTYAKILRRWSNGDRIELDLPMPVRMVVADPRVESTRNHVAVMRGPGYALPRNQAVVTRRREEMKKRYPGEKVGGLACGPATEAADVPDNAYADGRIADSAVLTLRKIKDRPFFLAVGYMDWDRDREL